MENCLSFCAKPKMIWTLSKNAQYTISKSLLECRAITAFVGAFDVKAFNDADLWKSCLASRNRIVNFHRRNKRKRRG